MNAIKNLSAAVLFMLTAMYLQACSSSLPNLGDVKEQIANYYQSGRYEAELNKAADKAIAEFDNITASDSSLVVFDIDETALSNYEYEKDVDFGYTSDSWESWLNDTKAPAIDGVKRLYDFLINKGFKVAFVTGRTENFYTSTYDNLINAGYAKFDTLIVRSSSEDTLSALEYKSKKRVELTQKGYNIVGDVGDQYSDLDGPDHGIQVKIPNYMYLIK